MSDAAAQEVFVHAVTGPRGSNLERTLAGRPHTVGRFRPLVGPLTSIVVRVSGPPELLAEARAGLPHGPAQAEAVAVRLRRQGVPVRWAEAEILRDAASLERLSHERGRSSVQLLRADPTLVTELQVGGWFEATWQVRALRRAAVRFRRLAPSVRLRSDAAFWAGVRTEATAREWRRLTVSSYVVFYYHRLAGEAKLGQERLDVPPQNFDRQLRLLRLLRFRPLASEELLEFHGAPDRLLPRRGYVVTVDDGFRDAAAALRRHADVHPQLFVPTAEVGGRAWWADGEPLAGWEELGSLERLGVALGGHSRRHAPLTDLDPGELAVELRGTVDDLAERLSRPAPVLAYPHGLHDEAVRDEAIAAGFRAAFTTLPGRNGAGTDPYCLRRIGVKAWDGRLSFLWKAVTGELLPRPWEGWRVIRARLGRRLRRSSCALAAVVGVDRPPSGRARRRPPSGA